MSRILSPKQGSVILDGADIHTLPANEVARRLAILPQSNETPGGLTVEQLVRFGRAPYQGLLGFSSTKDREQVRWALSVTNLVELSQIPVAELSGGQRQRAWIAMALAQDTNVLLLDEPTTYLDMGYQVEIMELIKNLNREQNRTIIMVLHDLNQAARYADHLIAISHGKPRVSGPPAETLTQAMLNNVFGVDADVIQDPRTRLPMCVVYGAIKNATSRTTSMRR